MHAVLGSYEYDMRILFEARVSKSSVVYDIGAHVGFYTLLGSELVEAEGKVIAFEPVSRNLDYLKKHIDINHCANVTVVEAAVSNEDGTCLFYKDPGNHMGHISESGNLTVPVVSIDELSMSGKIPAPNYIKIDVEGAEALVLKGAERTLINHSPEIFLETHSPILIRNCCDLLTSLNYKLRPVVGDDLSQARWIFAYKES